jgi:nucleoside-diphosphate-sugar epimerase
MTKVLITGGSGFVGTNLVESYLREGFSVLNIDIAPPRNKDHQRYWVNVDICSSESLFKAISDYSPDLVLHMAARTDLGGKNLMDYSANIDGVNNLINCLLRVKSIKSAVFASSMLVCKIGYIPTSDLDYCPSTVYGESKVVGEKLLQKMPDAHFSWSIVRPTSLWGPWFSSPYKGFFDLIAKQLYFHPRGVEVQRNYGFVLNAVHQIMRIADYSTQSQVHKKTFYIADYEPISIYAWAKDISSEFNVNSPKIFPLFLFELGAKFGDFLKLIGIKNPHLTSFRLKNMMTNAIYDLGPTMRIAGQSPFTIKEGVKITVDWIKSSKQINS